MSEIKMPSALRPVDSYTSNTTTPAPMTAEPVNHEEALQLSHLTKNESNLARCYIVLTARIAELERQWSDRIAIQWQYDWGIDLAVWRKRAETAEAELAAARKPPEDGEVADYVLRVHKEAERERDEWKARWANAAGQLEKTHTKLQTARRDALEKAAKIADEWATLYQRQLGNGGPAAAIRAIQQKDIGK